MTRKKKTSLRDDAAEAIDPLSDESQLKTIRELETRLRRSEGERRVLTAKLKQSEDELKHERERLAVFAETRGKFNPKEIAVGTRKRSGSATAIFCGNDWHAEENIDPDTIDGANELNLDIAEKRIHRFGQKAVYLLESQRSISNIQDAVLWLGGDLINGSIHEELAEANFLGQGPAVKWVQDRCAELIQFILKEANLKSLLVACNYGNHGRSTKRKRIATGHWHSWEWLAYHNIADKFRAEPRVTFKIENGYHNWVEIQGRTVRFHHGDNVKYWGGVGGLTIPLNKAVAEWNKRRVADYDVLGHFHQFLNTWRVTACGCLCGYSAYALSIKAEFQPPTQTFIVIDRQYGKVLATPIFCEAT